MISRQDYERREDRNLAPYAARSSASRGRAYPEDEHPYRTAFQRDRDRIVHSTAFRRLEYKTQVFVNYEGDHYRTRLTHTLEVVQIGRTVARALGLNEDLAESIALAHDLGHTPFGHSGEDALRELMKEHGGFEHNRHGLRVVDLLEKPYRAFPGLNLTYEVREGIAKHSTTWDRPSAQGFDPGPPSLEAQAVEMADSIAYDNHDLDDGLSSQLLDVRDLDAVGLWHSAAEALRREAGELDEKRLRAHAVRYLINLLVSDLIECSQSRLHELNPSSIEDVRACKERLLSFSPELAELKSELEDFLFNRLYRHHLVMQMTNKARRFVKDLFRAYVEDPRQLPNEYQERIAEEGVHRVVCDYIAGMTDRYAQDQYLKLFQPYERM